MKKQTKIISLVVVMVLLLGAFAVFASAFEASATPSAEYGTAQTTDYSKNLTVANHSNGSIDGFQLINWSNNGLAQYTVTDPDGNTYSRVEATVDKVSGNPFLWVQGKQTIDLSGYVVLDFDIAIDTDVVDTLRIYPDFRGAAKTISGKTTTVADIIPSDGKWHHYTFFGSVSTNWVYIFVDGSFVKSYEGLATTNANLLSTACTFKPRIDIPTNTLLAAGESFSLDNISVRVFGASEELAAVTTSNNISGWSEKIVAPAKETLPSIATIDGVKYSSVSAVEAALATGSNHEVTIDRAVNWTVEANSTATIKTVADRANFISSAGLGYIFTDNGDNTYTGAKDTRTADITVKIADSTYVFEDVVYGTDVLEMLEDEGIVIRGTAAVDKSHNIYTGITWDVTPVKVAGDATYTATGTKYTNAFLALDDNGAIVEYSDYDATNFANAVFGTKNTDITNRTVVLNANFAVASSQRFIYGSKSIYLNGHTITPEQPASIANHTFVIDPSSAGDFSITGPGLINNTVRGNNATGQVIYTNTNYAGTVTLKNLDIVNNSSFAWARHGSFIMENCTMDSINTQGVQIFQFGYTTMNFGVNATFKNCDIRNRYYHNYSGFFFINWNTIPKNTVNTVVFEDCKLDFGFGNETAIACNNPNNASITFEFNGCDIHCNNMFYYSETAAFNATALFGEGTRVSKADYKGSAVAEGLKKVYSGDPTLPYEFTANYATVNWSDGTTTYWADGSTPVNGNARYDGVCVVEGGKKYDFVQATDKVPFQMFVNLSLTSNIQYNVYINEDADVTSVQIGDVVYDFASHTEYSEGTLMGKCKMFTLEVAPYLASGDYTIVVTTPTYSVARTISLAEYAKQVYATYPASSELMSNILKYVTEAQVYFGVHSTGYSDIQNLLATHANSIIAPEEKGSNMSALTSYISSAAINVTSTPAFRFNLVAGADITGLKVTVLGEEVAYTVGNGYIEVSLKASQMTEDIVITVGEASGNYNLYTYYNYVITTAEGALNDATVEKRVCYRAVELIKALYSYAAVAGK